MQITTERHYCRLTLTTKEAIFVVKYRALSQTKTLGLGTLDLDQIDFFLDRCISESNPITRKDARLCKDTFLDTLKKVEYA